MIAKRVTRTSGDRFGRLARYIAAASDKGEKLDALWLAGCDAGDSDLDPAADPDLLDMAIMEIEATQALNTRAKTDKTYHLILSFRNDRPDAAALKDIEAQFADALGMAEHQRVVATHQNTDNFHMHVAFNKVHPVTLNCITPFQDFRALETTCRAVEAQYGLSVDNGRAEVLAASKAPESVTHENAAPPLSPAARDFEAHRWEASFERHVKDLLPSLEASRLAAASWQDLHDGFGAHELRLKMRGNGLVITDKTGKNRMKASSLGRQLAKPSLEKQLGPFAPAKRQRLSRQSAKAGYSKRPLTRHRHQAKIWAKYLAQSTGRTAIARSTNHKESLTRRAFKSWKAFLLAEAITDPLAMAIIIAQRKIIGGMTLGK